MDTSLFSVQGLEFLFRWGHFLTGVCWIGVLWYFNFIQGPYFLEADTQAKSDATKKLVPRALWWFRWGAMGTFLSGLGLLMFKAHGAGMEVFNTSWGAIILVGALMGTFMWFNVWFIIWPSQKKIISAAKSGQTPPAAAAARAALASRTNTCFSIPLLFFMGGASHLPLSIDWSREHGGGIVCALLTASVLVLLIEANGLFGKMGPLKTVRGVICSGFVLTAILFGVLEGLT